jgi:hypothetical protein
MSMTPDQAGKILSAASGEQVPSLHESRELLRDFRKMLSPVQLKMLSDLHYRVGLRCVAANESLDCCIDFILGEAPSDDS